MITYPYLNTRSKIGVTAPSSGVPSELHNLLRQSAARLEEKGYSLSFGETVWTQEKARSADAEKRAAEFMKMMDDESIEVIMPPWGGELLIEILDFLDFEKMKAKWVLGYSDTSALLLSITLKTGIATAHGTNFIDLRGEYWDETTAMWEKVLTTKREESVSQTSSLKYQEQWEHEKQSPCVFHLTHDTEWKTVSNKEEKLKGRLLGGCIDIIHHLAGTPYGDVKAFHETFADGESLVWYFENCDLNMTGLRRAFLHMKMAGWFKSCSGIMFGRSSSNTPVNGYGAEDVYEEISSELGIPIIYDIDCGHQPPQVTLINGAYAEVEVSGVKGVIKQYFK
ncbi:S66 family peptidase [Rossellomorea aquimaris]|uniref:Peptidase S66 n=1 Tax=Rossellomorea aquimaris TaxID=189382 RepID=A0A1J6WJD4_9BACI|nr:S66 peptidase family protein [Rossellomorea aquimaris]OIU71952.1 peptidase S66 [Rossellomorea aquimaris]